MLKDLSQADFDFYKSYSQKMQDCHSREFMENINPDIIRAFYRGRKEKDDRFTRMGKVQQEEHILMFSTLFATANKVLPNLYYKNPNPIAFPVRDATPESAALLTALTKYYMKVNNAKQENQEAVLNSYFFGLGYKKEGYTLETQPAEQIQDEPESQDTEPKKSFNFMNMLGIEKQPDLTQSKERPELVRYEGLFNASESPLNVMLDHKADLHNGKAFLHRLPRTLYELMNFGGYDQKALDGIYEKYRYVKGTRMDTRDIDLTFLELHVQQRNGIWILAYIDGFDKPLMYEKSTLQGCGFQFTPLCLTNEPGVRYPTSPMKIGAQTQDKIDKMASLFYEKIARSQDLLFLNENVVSKGQLEAVQQNKVRGIILTNNNFNPNSYVHVQSPAVQNDLPTLIKLAQQNMIEVMGSDPQTVQGKSNNDTLGQDQIAMAGTKIIESGMQDRVRDWMIKQIEKEAKLLQEYSNAEIKMVLNREDFSDPIMASKFGKQGMPVEFMTMNNPLGAKEYIKGEYRFEINIEEAIKPNQEIIRQGVERILTSYGTTSMRQDLQNDFKVLKTGLLWEVWLSTFQMLGNPQKYIEEIDSKQLAAMQVKDLMMNGMGKQMMAPKPQPKASGDGKAKTPNQSEPVLNEVGI